MEKLLLIDDDVKLVKLLQTEFAETEFEVEAAHTGEEAIDRLTRGSYALAVLDVMLPLMNGFEVLSHVRQFSDVPVLILSARGMPMDVSLGFRSGADDYLSKPFEFEELLLRIRAILKRSSIKADREDDEQNGAGGFEKFGLQAVPASQKFLFNGKDPGLTFAESTILRTLIESSGKIVERDILCREALGRPYDGNDRTLDNTVAILRKKLHHVGFDSTRIQAARGKGYFLSAE